MALKTKESDMFIPVKSFLIDRGCEEVYGEVGNFDVLGLNGPCNIIVEMKNQLSNKAIEQAIHALSSAHYVYIAVPSKKSTIPFFLKKMLEGYRIGVLYVDVEANDVSVVIPAKFNRAPINQKFDIRSRITHYQGDLIGGVKSGEQKTDYSIMIDEIKELLKRKRDWVTIDYILDNCETKYARPKPSLMATLQAEWNNDWCETKKEGRIRYFRLKSSASPVEND